MQVRLFPVNPIPLPTKPRQLDEGEGCGDYIPDEDYVEESDPGDTYYWYDGEGNVMYFDGSDSYYIGPDDVFYIDEAGRLMEY